MAERVKLSAEELAGAQPLAAPGGGGRERLTPEQLAGAKDLDSIGYGESALRGIKQGITLGFGDEITGAIESAFTGKTYRQARDEARANDAAAQTANPITYGAGEVGGGVATAFVPGLGVARGAGAAAKIANAAITGAAAGLGSSRADLAGGDVGGTALDTAIGGATGLAGGLVSHGLGKAAGAVGRSAETRAAERPAKELLEGIPAKQQSEAIEKLGGKAALSKELRDREMAKAVKAGPRALADHANERLDEIGQEIGAVYKKADALDPGVDKSRLFGSLRGLAEKYEREYNAPAAKQVRGEIAALEELAGDSSHVPAESVHKLVSRYGRAGFGGNYLNPTDAKMVGREMNAAARDVLQAHIDDVAQVYGKSAPAAELRRLNGEWSKMSTIADLAETKAMREERGAKTLGDRFKQLTSSGSVVGAIATGNPYPLAYPAAMAAAPYAIRAGDAALARLGSFVRSGGSAADAMAMAARLGVPRAMAEQMVSAWGSGAAPVNPAGN